jgi:hypothetical protein
VDSLQSDPQYPDGVFTNSFLTNFSTMQITGGDLNNNPAFGSLGDNYGDIVYGWIKPPATGSYTFFLRSDDASQLWLSSDANPANAAEIANEDGCCNPFQEPGPSVTQTSVPIALDASKSYYITALHKEGGGGDYVEVAWRQQGDTNAAAGLNPIPGAYFTAYAPVAQTAKFNTPTLNAGQVTLTWTGPGALQESVDLKTWTPMAGNPGSGYTVVLTQGASLKFYRLFQ